MSAQMDYQARSAELGDEFIPITEEQKAAARKVVAGNAVDTKGRTALYKTNLQEMASDTDELMHMLGIHPDQADDDKIVSPASDFNSFRMPSTPPRRLTPVHLPDNRPTSRR